jgi:hypothetical protein
VGEYSEGFVAFDVSKTKHAVAIADGGRGGEARFLGDVSSSPTTVERLIRKLAGRYDKLYFCYEAGPTGYGLYRRIEALGHTCLVVAPALIPKRPGERVKTNRRDAVTLARLHRTGELTGVRWRPCKPQPPHPRCIAPGVEPRWGTPVARYVAGPLSADVARRPSSRPRKSPETKTRKAVTNPRIRA